MGYGKKLLTVQLEWAEMVLLLIKEKVMARHLAEFIHLDRYLVMQATLVLREAGCKSTAIITGLMMSIVHIITSLLMQAKQASNGVAQSI